MHQEIIHGQRISNQAEFIWGQATIAGQIRVERRSQLIASLANLKEGSLILELGCGTGEYTRRLSKTKVRIIALDIARDLILQAKGKLDPIGIDFLIADIEHLPIRDESFEAVVGNAILHHLNLKIALPAIKRVLKPGGIITFTEPNMLNPQNLVVKNIKWLGKLVGESPQETAFFRSRLYNLLIEYGFEDVLVEPFDFLHPVTPNWLIPYVQRMGSVLENTPLIRHLSGSLMIKGKRN